MSVDIVITSAEQDALKGAPYFVRALYLAIRARMDFSTGIVGGIAGQRVSWWGLQEDMGVDPHQGLIESGTPVKSKVRRGVVWLVKLGLVEMRSEEMDLIFFLPKAKTDKSAQKKPGTNPAHPETAKPDTQENEQRRGLDGDFIPKPGTNPAHPETAKPGIHPVSGIYTGNSSCDLPRERALTAIEVQELLETAGVRVDQPSIGLMRGWIKTGITQEQLVLVLQACEDKHGKGGYGIGLIDKILKEGIYAARRQSGKQSDQRINNSIDAEQIENYLRVSGSAGAG